MRIELTPKASQPDDIGASALPFAGSAMPKARRRPRLAWYAAFAVLVVAGIFVVGHLTGVNALAASGRFLWNALALAANSGTRAVGSLLALLAKGIGWRRLSRLAGVVTGIGLSYAGGVLFSDTSLRRAHGWRDRLRLLIATLHKRWVDLPLAWKLLAVAALIASQVYLHVFLIVFPIAFLVPVMRRLWVQAADLVFGSWYWRTFGRLHRTIIATLRGLPGVRHLLGAGRVARIRYLTAWRLWKYHPRYRGPLSGRRRIDLLEPLRLWRRKELDIYLTRPLLAGHARPQDMQVPAETGW